ncbi:MAG TPA: hypothetical protein VK032_03225 [Burkholderiaceae bacterium]|nr:hypothetical protein [Burkholderiaceae bacterium]
MTRKSQNCEPKERLLDKNKEVHQVLETAMQQLSTMYAHVAQQRDDAAKDASLEDAEGVVESFDLLLEATTKAHKSLNDLNRAIMEHDANASPRSGKGPFKSAKDLIESLD